VSTLAEETSLDLLFPELDARTSDSVVEELATRIARALPTLSAPDLASGFAARETLGSTALGGGLAVPHCKVEGIQRAYLAVGLSRRGIDFGAADGAPVYVFFAVLSPLRAPGTHLRLLAAISRWAKQPGRIEALRRSRDRAALMLELEAAA
jgi:nitrogen PTS system EIIA component